jgi:hypothetical protein
MSSQELRDSLFIAQDQRSDFKQVIAKRSDLVQFSGARMKKAAAGTVVIYQAGTVVGYATSGADAGFYKVYNSANTDGSQVASGVLSEKVVTDEFGNGSEAAIIKVGTLFQDLLIGLDAAAITALGGKPFVEHGANIIHINA